MQMIYFRLRNDKNGGAWCPRQMVSRDAKEYLEINMDDLHVVTGVRTQGRFGNGQGQEYAEEYMIEYWRPGFVKWTRWKNRESKEVRMIPQYLPQQNLQFILSPPENVAFDFNVNTCGVHG